MLSMSGFIKPTFYLFLIIFLAVFLINIELTAVNLALTQIATDFSIQIGQTSSIVSFYLIFFSVFTLIGGKLGDSFGYKNIILWMLIIFILASLIGGYSKYYSLLLVARSMQGLSAGAMLPNLTALLYRNAPTQQKHYVIGFLSAVVGFSTASGPLIGSIITSYLNWRYIFFLNIPIGFFIIFGFLIFYKEENSFVYPKIDYVGMMLTMLTIFTLMEVVKSLSLQDLTFSVLMTLSFFVTFVGWLIWHLKTKSTFLSLYLFRKRTYLVGCFIRLFLGFTYYIILYVLGIFSQEVLRISVSFSGLIYLPMTLSVTLVSIFYGKISDKVNVVVLLRYGLILFLSGVVLFLFFIHSFAMIIFALVLIGSAYGVLYSSLFSITLHGINENNTSEASGALYFFNILGGTLGVAFAGASLMLHKAYDLTQTVYFGVSHALIFCSMIIFLCLIASFVFIKRLL